MATFIHESQMVTADPGNRYPGSVELNHRRPTEVRTNSYWHATRRPLPSLVFVLPLMLAYELAVLHQGGASQGTLRTGADFWLRHVLSSAGLTDQWFLPLLLVVILMGWQVGSSQD